MLNKTGNWLHDRVKIDVTKVCESINEPVPEYLKGLWFCLGGTPLICLVIQFATGIMLMFYYIPYQEVAYESVKFITVEARFGWLIRGIHHVSAQVMIASMFLHMARVYFTGAYRKPREITWMLGIVLMGITMGLGFTGYSLICDQVSYWATVVGTNIAGATPFIGDYLLLFMRGGQDVTQSTLTRFFVFHIAILPGALMMVLALHIFFIRCHGLHYEEDDGFGNAGSGKTGSKKEKKFYPFFPEHVLNELGIFLVLILSFTIYSYFFPPTLGESFNPNVTPEHIKPEWYFFGVFRYLKLVSYQVGILGNIFIGMCLFFWPFIDRLFEKCLGVKNAKITGYVLGMLFVLVWAIFTVWETLT
ncbi:MAG: cytochrome b [Candidatus Anammoxibacter sp.]